MRLVRIALIVAVVGWATATGGRRCLAQTPASATTLNVYLDCNDFQGCDFDFFRTEISSVNWVRDRQVADVHVLVTTQQTGSGGREYTVTFIGLRQFTALVDTLRYVSLPAEQPDQIRRGLARTLRVGLVRYVARTPAVDQLRISFGEDQMGPSHGGQTRPQNDSWNYWVFSTSVNGFKQGESTFGSGVVSLNLSANRTTEAWKSNISLNDSYNESSYTLSDGTSFKSIQRNYGANVLEVKSLGQHWSAGVRTSVASSTYSNQKSDVRFAPAVEYDIFPYSQSTRRQIRIEYNIGPRYVNYTDTTIFGKVSEPLPSQQLSISTATREQWGSIDLGINGTNYLQDRSKYNVSTFGSVSLRLIKGLSLSVFVNYSKFNDQFYLPKKLFTDQEILTRQFAQETTHQYFVNFGLSYTFGSIFNNVVNPRFGGGSGGMFFMQ